jgi:hypothetical protein
MKKVQSFHKYSTWYILLAFDFKGLMNSIGSVAVAAVGQADRGRSGYVVVEADIFVDKEEDTITWL